MPHAFGFAFAAELRELLDAGRTVFRRPSALLTARTIMWFVLCVACMAVLAPGAQATVTASVEADGTVLLQGDDTGNSITFGAGETAAEASPNAGYSAVVSSNDRQPIGIGSGCFANPSFTGYVFCGDGTSTSLEIDLGSGNDSVKFDPSSGYAMLAEWFSTVLINTGDGTNTVRIGGMQALDGGTTVTVNGGSGSDTINGTSAIYPQPDFVINGGAGDDTLTGGASTNTIDGDDGDDTIVGGSGQNTLDGDAGDDTISVDGGNATITGGSGKDIIDADSSSTKEGAAQTINAVDGEADQITCDPLGTTIINVDQYDVYNKQFCAQINVTDVGTCPTGETGIPPNCTPAMTACPTGETGTPPNCTPTTTTCPAGETGTPPNCRMPTAPLRASISVLRGQSPVKHKQIKANVGCSAACYVAAHAQIRIANAKPFSVRSVVVHLRAAGRKQVVLAFSRSQESKLKAALKAHKKVTATVESVLTNAHHSSNQGTSTTAKLKISD